MTLEEYKNRIIDKLNYCIAATREVAIEDNLEGEDLELSNAYCEGLEDAIYKINEFHDDLK